MASLFNNFLHSRQCLFNPGSHTLFSQLTCPKFPACSVSQGDPIHLLGVSSQQFIRDLPEPQWWSCFFYRSPKFVCIILTMFLLKSGPLPLLPSYKTTGDKSRHPPFHVLWEAHFPQSSFTFWEFSASWPAPDGLTMECLTKHRSICPVDHLRSHSQLRSSTASTAASYIHWMKESSIFFHV